LPEIDGEGKANNGNLDSWMKAASAFLLIAASILSARRVMNWDGRPPPAAECAIADAIVLTERILAKIDARWPAK